LLTKRAALVGSAEHGSELSALAIQDETTEPEVETGRAWSFERLGPRPWVLPPVQFFLQYSSGSESRRLSIAAPFPVASVVKS
jgi:hypothetical protein